jgi:hypothetical protein
VSHSVTHEDENHCRGIIAEVTGSRAVAFWSRKHDAYKGEYTKWTLEKVVLEDRVRAAMGEFSWLERSTFNYTYADPQSDHAKSWLRGYLRALADGHIKAVYP